MNPSATSNMLTQLWFITIAVLAIAVLYLEKVPFAPPWIFHPLHFPLPSTNSSGNCALSASIFGRSHTRIYGLLGLLSA